MDERPKVIPQEMLNGGRDRAAELERFIADADARGEPVPEQARAMLIRLRELFAAIDDLEASLRTTGTTGTTGTTEGGDA